MKNISLPVSFAKMKLNIGWRDMLWAHKKGIFGWKDALIFAAHAVENGSVDSDELKLAKISKDQLWEVPEIIEILANKSDILDEEVLKRRWMVITLAWIYENRSNLEDPLGLVEEVYSDYDYPSSIESFVRFMPATEGYDPSRHTKDENEQRLFFLWGEFLEKNLAAIINAPFPIGK